MCFWYLFWQVLRFTVHEKGMNVDPTKDNAIQVIKPLTSCKQLKSFMGRVYYVRRFVSSLD